MIRWIRKSMQWNLVKFTTVESEPRSRPFLADVGVYEISFHSDYTHTTYCCYTRQNFCFISKWNKIFWLLLTSAIKSLNIPIWERSRSRSWEPKNCKIRSRSRKGGKKGEHLRGNPQSTTEWQLIRWSLDNLC